jgi:hypothetical protein
MARLAFHLPRLVGLAFAIAAAAFAYGLHSLKTDAPASAADAATEPALARPCLPGHGLTSHAPPLVGTSSSSDCVTSRRPREKAARCKRRRPKHRTRRHAHRHGPPSSRPNVRATLGS